VPLALSFFTIQQVAYLVDTYRGEVAGQTFLRYLLFVTFFPRLLAGPILRYREVGAQFADPQVYRFRSQNLSAGLTLFSMGLFKKVVFADVIGRFADSAFHAAALGAVLTMQEAWSGALSFTFQIYFDFSGYTDMALGIAWMFGILLPHNFDSPYKASSLVEFWRGWHRTLSRFVRDYLYIPLGGNRKGFFLQGAGLVFCFLLIGLWHGPAGTFILWALSHGVLTMLNHVWRTIRQSREHNPAPAPQWETWLGRVATFTVVTVLWVIFRSPDLPTAASILKSMAGLHPMPEAGFNNVKINEDRLYLFLAVCWFLPNSRQVMANLFDPDRRGQGVEGWRWWEWRANEWWAGAAALFFIVSLLMLETVRPFIYFQF